MFLFTKNAKERVVTGGTVIALLLLLALSLRTAWVGGYDLILSLLCILIAAAIFKGVRLGYTTARFGFGATAIIVPGGIINPFCYEDVVFAHGSYGQLVYESLLISVLCVVLFWCLGEHARLRNLKEKPWFPAVSTPVLCWVILGLLLLELLPLVTMMKAVSPPPSTINLRNAKELAEGCNHYAKDHGGKYPAKLHDLVPVYIPEVIYSITMFHDFSGTNVSATTSFLGIKTEDTSREYMPHPAQEWAYYGAQPLKPGAILIASPAPSTIPQGPVRVVIYTGEEMHGAVISEDEFQREIKTQQ